jgi:molybdopterin converting factor small subunit
MRILFFAQARKAAALDSVEWKTEIPQSVNALWSWLEAGYPALAPLRRISRIACNEEYFQERSGEGMLQPDDVVAIIPPVSGG